MLLSGLLLNWCLCLTLQATAKLDDARKRKLDEMFQQAVLGGGTSAAAAAKGGVTATSSASSSPGIKRGTSMPVSAWALASQVCWRSLLGQLPLLQAVAIVALESLQTAALHDFDGAEEPSDLQRLQALASLQAAPGLVELPWGMSELSDWRLSNHRHMLELCVCRPRVPLQSHPYWACAARMRRLQQGLAPQARRLWPGAWPLQGHRRARRQQALAAVRGWLTTMMQAWQRGRSPRRMQSRPCCSCLARVSTHGVPRCPGEAVSCELLQGVMLAMCMAWRGLFRGCRPYQGNLNG